jgi:hypothetical protein
MVFSFFRNDVINKCSLFIIKFFSLLLRIIHVVNIQQHYWNQYMLLIFFQIYIYIGVIFIKSHGLIFLALVSNGFFFGLLASIIISFEKIFSHPFISFFCVF